eukprot:PhM_4_TR4339/c0_g1_i2/m.73518
MSRPSTTAAPGLTVNVKNLGTPLNQSVAASPALSSTTNSVTRRAPVIVRRKQMPDNPPQRGGRLGPLREGRFNRITPSPTPAHGARPGTSGSGASSTPLSQSTRNIMPVITDPMCLLVNAVKANMKLMTVRVLQNIGVPVTPEETTMLVREEYTGYHGDYVEKIDSLDDAREHVNSTFRFAVEEVAMRWKVNQQILNPGEDILTKYKEAMEQQIATRHRFEVQVAELEGKVQQLNQTNTALTRKIKNRDDSFSKKYANYEKEVNVLKEYLYRAYREKGWHAPNDVDYDTFGEGERPANLDEENAEVSAIVVQELQQYKKMIKVQDEHVNKLTTRLKELELLDSNKSKEIERLKRDLAQQTSMSIKLRQEAGNLSDTLELLNLKIQDYEEREREGREDEDVEEMEESLRHALSLHGRGDSISSGFMFGSIPGSEGDVPGGNIFDEAAQEAALARRRSSMRLSKMATHAGAIQRRESTATHEESEEEDVTALLAEAAQVMNRRETRNTDGSMSAEGSVISPPKPGGGGGAASPRASPRRGQSTRKPRKLASVAGAVTAVSSMKRRKSTILSPDKKGKQRSPSSVGASTELGVQTEMDSEALDNVLFAAAMTATASTDNRDDNNTERQVMEDVATSPLVRDCIQRFVPSSPTLAQKRYCDSEVQTTAGETIPTSKPSSPVTKDLRHHRASVISPRTERREHEAPPPQPQEKLLGVDKHTQCDDIIPPQRSSRPSLPTTAAPVFDDGTEDNTKNAIARAPSVSGEEFLELQRKREYERLALLQQLREMTDSNGQAAEGAGTVEHEGRVVELWCRAAQCDPTLPDVGAIKKASKVSAKYGVTLPEDKAMRVLHDPTRYRPDDDPSISLDELCAAVIFLMYAREVDKGTHSQERGMFSSQLEHLKKENDRLDKTRYDLLSNIGDLRDQVREATDALASMTSDRDSKNKLLEQANESIRAVRAESQHIAEALESMKRDGGNGGALTEHPAVSEIAGDGSDGTNMTIPNEDISVVPPPLSAQDQEYIAALEKTVAEARLEMETREDIGTKKFREVHKRLHETNEIVDFLLRKIKLCDPQREDTPSRDARRARGVQAAFPAQAGEAPRGSHHDAPIPPLRRAGRTAAQLRCLTLEAPVVGGAAVDADRGLVGVHPPAAWHCLRQRHDHREDGGGVPHRDIRPREAAEGLRQLIRGVHEDGAEHAVGRRYEEGQEPEGRRGRCTGVDVRRHEHCHACSALEPQELRSDDAKRRKSRGPGLAGPPAVLLGGGEERRAVPVGRRQGVSPGHEEDAHVQQHEAAAPTRSKDDGPRPPGPH